MAFERPFHRETVSWPSGQCPCGARAAYRLTRRGESKPFLRCPACANTYPNDKYDHEALPHARDAFEQLIYASYRNQRTEFPHVTPERWARSFKETFGPRIEQLEARYQAELAGKSRAS